MCQSMGQAICELKNMPLSGDKELDSQIKKWVKWDRNQDTLCQIMEAVRNEDWDTLRCRLCRRIDFGTAGLRAVMRAGFDSMNELVIIQTSQGLCAYIKEQYPDEAEWAVRGVVIGFDGRYNSQRFAELTAIVFLSNNFRVYQFKRMVGTPFVPYTVMRMNSLAGVMITASHNPKQENGYKVYWSNGAQIIPPHDEGVQNAIMENLQPHPDSWDETLLCNNESLSDPYNNVLPPYYDSLKKEISCPLMEANGNCPLTFTYTPMHGVGYAYVKLAFSKINLKAVIPVLQQIAPDPEFPTAPSPNPEDPKTLCLAIERANEKKTQVILANDPDADRLVVAELDENKKFKIFTGNEMGALLGWWSLENYKMNAENPDIANCVMISSTVSSKLLKSMAQVEGFTHHETLTGFKWIGNKAIEEQNAGKKVLFGFEEAVGYMISTNVVDKDGIRAAAHVATMACYLRCKKCMTMQEKLRDLYETYGFHATVGSYVMCNDSGLTKRIFDRLRTFDDGQENTYPTNILDGEYEVESVRDLTTGYDSSTPDKKPVLPVSESSQMITFVFKNGMEVTLRTSGTEPKIKYYAEMGGKPENKHWDELTTTLNKMMDGVITEFLEPAKNGLKVRKEE
ncbi:phosphoglucomutase-2 [Drosophila mojavensis]|uniref:phosphoglucomutase-2 n=1 Tax=Drosophila mojavensis TaxID=7230 RepID=UPI001CD17021|nr:phosphoglucomutase-2 [Drosophila mojavensis]